ncbi:MAG: hypothetical protein JWM57_466 [Phycisphaerales bacterium]|nr:hypothetical protein [Phycisphaerales bacterium]
MSPQLLERISNCTDLPSLPAIAVQVLELTQAENVDLSQIADVISRDPALTGRILRTVNSSFYGRARNVGTISQAIVVLGLQSVKTLVLGFSLVTSVAGKKSKGFEHTTYWKHSLFTATASRLIAQRVGVVQVEEVFLAGLLADVGMLVLDRLMGEAYGPVARRSHFDLAAAEQAAFGTTHGEVSGHLAVSWKLPPLLTTPIACHHDTGAVAEPTLRRLAEIVSAASRCADVFTDPQAGAAIADVRERMKTFNLDASVGDSLMGELQIKAKEIAKLFDINIGESESFEKVLQRANEALVNMMLQSQQQTTTLRQQNEQLREQATTDRLTGLSNRADFEHRSAALWDAAIANGTPLCLMMIDLDKFKSINDTYGHPGGDEVLRAVGKILKTTCRPMDVLARYGGEELVLVLPDTPRAVAAAIAESIRLMISAKPVMHEGAKIQVTASFGVASFETGSPLTTFTHLIKAADMALYQAKKTGRDRVKVFQPNVAVAA